MYTLLANGLTEKQERVRGLRDDEHKSLREIAEIVGVSPTVIRKQFTVINKKLGIVTSQGKRQVEVSAYHRIEYKDPEKTAAIIDALTEPAGTYENIKQAFENCGLPKPVSEALIHRLRVKYQGAITETKALKTADLLTIINKKLSLVFHYLDDKVLAEASARDLMLGASALTEKRQLLMGEPTAILSDTRRKELNELLPMLVKEAGRRGITIDGQVSEKVIG